MLKIWFTSDLHFSHKNVIKYCNRPFESVEEMRYKLIENWNDVVQSEDVVYVLGDVFFCGTQEATRIMQQLNGVKILIRGNHDQKPTKMIKLGFHAVLENAEMMIAGTKVNLSHFPYKPNIPEKAIDRVQQVKGECRKKGIDSSSVLDEAVTELKKKGILTNEQAEKLINYDIRYFGRRLEDDGSILLCGHVHEKWAELNNMINVGVDVRNYKPMSYDEVETLVNIMKQKNV